MYREIWGRYGGDAGEIWGGFGGGALRHQREQLLEIEGRYGGRYGGDMADRGDMGEV